VPPSDPATPAVKEERRRFLDPTERSSEVLFGLIMVLTFTGSLSATSSGHADVHIMLVGALGCSLAWGTIDAVFYLMGTLSERGRPWSRIRKRPTRSPVRSRPA
jgi:hypothetical protein